MTFQPRRTSTSRWSTSRFRPARRLQQTEAVGRSRRRNRAPRPECRSGLRADQRRQRARERRAQEEPQARPAPSSSAPMRSTMAAVPDARVSFQSQGGGGPDAAARDIMLYLGGDDPVKLLAAANKIAEEMQTIPGLRAPRVGGDLARPEIVIKPRFDLAADLGVTTAALSQTIRIATLGDIEQNSAKFSLSDRQVPITVSLSENSRRDMRRSRTCRCRPRAAAPYRSKAVAEIGFGSGPTTIQRTNQIRRIAVGADLAPGPGQRRRVAEDQRAADRQAPAAGRPEAESRRPEMAGRAGLLFHHRARWRRPAGVRGAGAALPPVPGAVRQHGLVDPGPARRGGRACTSPASRCRCRC